LALTIPRLAKLGSNFGSNKRTRSRPDKRAEMNFALFYFGRRGENKKEDVTTKTGTPINYLSIPRGRLYISIDLNPLTEMGRAVKSEIVNNDRITTRLRGSLRKDRREGKKPIGKTIESTERLCENSCNVWLKRSLILRKIEIALELHTKVNPRSENGAAKIFHTKLQRDVILMSPELVNSVGSHIGTKLRTFV
jgi:hypothetical protein